MRSQLKIKGKLAAYYDAPVRLGILLLIINVIVWFINWPSGLLLTFFSAAYFVIILMMRYNNRNLLQSELVSFATEYGQIQSKLLKNLELAHAILDDGGHIIWNNYAF